MNKEVIYIDVDDDVTAIIGKIKKSKEKIVALVPPKRTGVLQSAVNLRLLDRMAGEAKKKLVLVTNNQALVALAANASIPVAKNLQSKPEIAEIPAIAVDEDDDIIDGAILPVGDHAGDIKVVDGTKEEINEDVIKGIDVESKAAKKPTKNKVKIPDFNTFRKRFILIAIGVLLLTVGLVWAFVFAPAATVVITARTTPVSVNSDITLAGSGTTDADKKTLATITKQDKKDISVEFEATGVKDLGDKATGTMKLTRTSVSSTPISVPEGTRFISGDLVFFSTVATTLGGTDIGPGGIVQPTATVTVEASEAGDKYNVSPRTYQSSVSGFSSVGSAMTGGTTDIATVVSNSDLEKARNELQDRNFDEEKAALMAQFTHGEKVISSSFTVDKGAEVLSPKQNQAVKEGEKATLTIPVTFTVTAVPQADLDEFLNDILAQDISEGTQFIYNNGAENVEIGNYNRSDDAVTATIIATGSVGPKIDEAVIKEAVKGKRYGPIQQELEKVDGIQAVDVHFSYFWVRTVPNNTNKITIEFQVHDE